MSVKFKPLLAITMGDACGSGPEIIAKALADPEIRAESRVVVIGDASTMREALAITGAQGEIRSIDEISAAAFQPGVIDVLDLHNIDIGRLVRGRVDPMGGQTSYEYIKLATELALAGRCDAVVTSAINKEALNKAGYHYDGHTQLLAELCGNPEVAMMLVSDTLRVSHVTTHVSLRRALDLVRPERILAVLSLTNAAVRQMGIEEPRLAVSGLNPHAGDGGLFGDEEERLILPAVRKAQTQGLRVTGPLPPDSVFFRAAQGQFDAAIAMYHDQGHIALKMLGLTQGVNVTLGLPIIRTSVDHGTNFGKAGKGTADPISLTRALKLAGLMCRNKKGASGKGKA
jgi:4-phospho-D-threonate 3-dehydrogenase / 4-phospho-D-erythronate 3-dehydrogenase